MFNKEMMEEDQGFRLERISLDFTEQMAVLMDAKGMDVKQLSQIMGLNSTGHRSGEILLRYILNGTVNASLYMMDSIAHALGCKLEVKMVQKEVT